MIRRIKLLRNIGQFDSVSTGASIDLERLVLIYAENGRGKTTLGAIFRSLASGDPNPIIERHRLSAHHQPHVVLDCDGVSNPRMFQNGTWNHTLPELSLFDDTFVDENIHSGLAVDARHRRNLHTLVLGSQGVELSRLLECLVSRIEEHNRALRKKSADIPDSMRSGMPVDDFCELPEIDNIDARITETERALAGARDQHAIGSALLFEKFSLPAFDTSSIVDILDRGLAELDVEAESRVRVHFEALGRGAEQWIGDGMQRLSLSTDKDQCPFCAQDLSSSTILDHYRSYFSQGYADLKRAVSETLVAVRSEHSGDTRAAFERAIRVAGETRHFWSNYCDLPEVTVDTAKIVRHWNAAREGALAVLNSKQVAPLERMKLSQETIDAIASFETHRRLIAGLSKRLSASNRAILLVKEQAAGASPEPIARDLSRLEATKRRHIPEIASLCSEYLAEQQSKAHTEHKRAQTRSALEQYQSSAFPTSQVSVNRYLRVFGAGFQLDSVTSTATRAGSACTYNVLINSRPVAITSATQDGVPSFRNTLSSGDRNTLALAFFFASMDQEPDLANLVIVIDDPISSLDDHRSLTTVQEVRRLAEQAGQVILLSHDKRFLCRVWEGADRTTRTALELARSGGGSTLRTWSVDEDSLTEHDRRHASLREFITNASGAQREIARSIRHHLEGFLRVAHPEHFPPGMLLGRFLSKCEEQLRRSDEILNAVDVQELSELVEYANKFHHDTNPAWETELINDAELQGFVSRTLAFARR